MQDVTEAKLDDWRDRLEPMLAGLQDFVVGPNESLDHSVESLRDLEHVLLAETPAGQPPREGLAEALGGYLGEVLLTIGGGAWTWDPDSDLPVTDLGVGVGETAEPMRLVLDALAQRSGTVWSAEYERIRAMAAARRNEDPFWEPRRTDPPALHTETSDAAPTDPWLTHWLTIREQEFPDTSQVPTEAAGETAAIPVEVATAPAEAAATAAEAEVSDRPAVIHPEINLRSRLTTTAARTHEQSHVRAAGRRR